MRSALQHGRQAVGDDQGGAALHGLVQGALHQALVLGVQRAGGLVEQQDRRLADQGAGDGQPLALAAGQACGRARRPACRSPRAGRRGSPRPGRRGRRRCTSLGRRPRGRSGCSRRPSRRTAGSPGPPAPCARAPRPDRPRAGRRRPAGRGRPADRRSAAAGGRPCSCPRPRARPAPPARPAAPFSEKPFSAGRSGPAGIGEGHALEAPPRRAAGCGRASGWAGGAIAGPRVEQLADPLHGAGGLLHVAPGLAQRADRARGHHRQEGELEERAPASSRPRRPACTPSQKTADDAAEHQRR